MFNVKKTFLLVAFLFAASDLFGAYKIKIAVYKDHANLMRFISKVPGKSYRKNILIEKKNHLHYVTSTLYESENEANKALRRYKKVFPDAFILEVKQKSIVPASVKVVTQTPSKPESIVSIPVKVLVQTPEEPEVPEVIEKESVPSFDAKNLLGNKTIYICNENGSKKAQKEVIRLDFKKEYVLYTKLSRNVPPIEIPYAFDQDCLILPMSGIDFKYQIHTQGDDFLSAKSFIKDKEGNHFRYYFDEDLAFKFTKRQ